MQIGRFYRTDGAVGESNPRAPDDIDDAGGPLEAPRGSMVSDASGTGRSAVSTSTRKVNVEALRQDSLTA